MKLNYIKILYVLLICKMIIGNNLKVYSQSKEYKISDEVRNAVDSLALIKEIRMNGTVRFSNLLKVATNEDLVYLTKNINPNIRCYAFNGLKNNKYSQLKDIFLEHIKDTSTVNTRYECLGERLTVMNFMLNHFQPKNIRVKEKLDETEYKKFLEIAENYKEFIIPEKYINREEEIKKIQNSDLSYFQEYYWAESKDSDFKSKRKLVTKTIEFIKFQEMILATAYFEVNGCNSHFPNIERKKDEIILKYQLLNKNPCDEESRDIFKINFIINDNYLIKIKKVTAE